MTTLKIIFAIIGALYSLYFFIGLTIDITTFDQTKGGYEAPMKDGPALQSTGTRSTKPKRDL